MGKRKRPSETGDDQFAEDVPSPSFEESMAQLQSIIADLESGKLTLDQSLQRYEAGVEQLRLCQRSLARVEQRIRLLVDIDENGKATTLPFDHQASVDSQSNRPAAKGIHGDLPTGAPPRGAANRNAPTRPARTNAHDDFDEDSHDSDLD
jgi:exodeoxyribonuclease VII small subunit